MQFTLEHLYAAIRHPVVVRTDGDKAFLHMLKYAPHGVRRILTHPMKVEIDGKRSTWHELSWSQKRKTVQHWNAQTPGTILRLPDITEYYAWLEARVSTLAYTEMLSAIGSGGKGGGGRIKLSYWKDSQQYNNAHALLVPTQPPMHIPLALFFRQVDQDEQLRALWKRKRYLGERLEDEPGYVAAVDRLRWMLVQNN